MQLVDHFSITVRDLRRSARFYDAVMASLGAAKVYQRQDAIGYGERNRAATTATATSASTSPTRANVDRRRHWCFRAQSAEQVRAFHAAGLAAGGRDAGAPGLRPDYHPGYYAAFLEDPEGNRVEAVFHQGQ